MLDDEIPIIAGSEINDNPYAPISVQGRQLVAELGDELPLDWVPREVRYGEKLATPDITIADLIGEIDPIKVAEGRYSDGVLAGLACYLKLNFHVFVRARGLHQQATDRQHRKHHLGAITTRNWTHALHHT